MPSVKLYSKVNQLKAYVLRLRRSLKLRDERIERLTAEGLGLQESLTVVGEQRDEAQEELAKARGLPTDSEVCQSCGSAVTLVWHASDEDWNSVVGGPGGLRCARCFAAEAWEKRGLNLAFLAVPLRDGWTEPAEQVRVANALTDELRRRGLILLNNLSVRDMTRLSLQDRRVVYEIATLTGADIKVLDEVSNG